MDFTPGETQQAVAGLAAQVLTGSDPWKELAKAGLLSVADDGLGVLDVAVLLTETARRAPEHSLKALATLMTGALPVLRWGTDELRQALLPGVASGELLLTAAIREPTNPATPATTITHGKITGTKVGVLWAQDASFILLPASMIMARNGHIAAQTGHDHGVATHVALVDPRAGGVTLTRTPSSSGEPEYTVRLDEAPVEAVLAGADCVADLYRLATAGACATLDGAVAGALALTRDHVASREQFGRPLAAFQAVSQQIADIYIASRTMHLAALSACWRLEQGLDPDGDLDVAAWWCAGQAPGTVRTCHHLHGGLGMDVTYPLHRFSSLVTDLARYLGGAGYRLERLACSST